MRTLSEVLNMDMNIINDDMILLEKLCEKYPFTTSDFLMKTKDGQLAIKSACSLIKYNEKMESVKHDK